MDLEEWAMENAPRVVTDVERHGLTMTWSEAHVRLLQIATFLELPAFLDERNGELVPLPQDDEPLWRHRTNFAEDVAGGIVHYEGKAFFPADPATSNTPIAVPWAIASELVTRLGFLLSVRLGTTTPEQDPGALHGIAVLVTNLSARVADQMAWLGDEELDDRRIEGHRCLLMCASQVWRAAVLLRDAAEHQSPTVENLAPGLDEGLLTYLNDRQDADTFLWDLEWWITDRTLH